MQIWPMHSSIVSHCIMFITVSENVHTRKDSENTIGQLVDRCRLINTKNSDI